MYVLVVNILAYIQFLFLLIGTPLESLEKIGDFSSPDFLCHYVSHRRQRLWTLKEVGAAVVRGLLCVCSQITKTGSFFLPLGKNSRRKTQNSMQKKLKLKLKTQFLVYFGKLVASIEKNL